MSEQLKHYKAVCRPRLELYVYAKDEDDADTRISSTDYGDWDETGCCTYDLMEVDDEQCKP